MTVKRNFSQYAYSGSYPKQFILIAMLLFAGSFEFAFAQSQGEQLLQQKQMRLQQSAQPQTKEAPRNSSSFVIARLKYGGGGDWYNDPSSELNLLEFVRDQTNIDVALRSEEFVEAGSEKLHSYPFVFMTGHGNMKFTQREAENLRSYLEHGGFLYVDDDYGLDKAFRREIKKVFPDRELVELPFSHEIYHVHFEFPSGLPKIHEHDEKAPRGYGLFHRGRLVLFYTFESNLADGWADADVHKDPETVRRKALEMGTNIIVWALMN